VVGSLLIVLALFMVFAWMLRRMQPKSAMQLPAEVFEAYGRGSLGGKQQVQLVRCGRKLLLLAVGPGGVETLTEITDPVEVDRLSGLCHAEMADSATTNFRQVFEQLAFGRTRDDADLPAETDYGQSHAPSVLR